MGEKYCDQHGSLIEIKDMVTDIKKAILGDISDEKTVGLRNMVLFHEKKLRLIFKIQWLIIAALIGGIVQVFFK